MSLVGATVQFRFQSGFTVQAKYLSADRMQWAADGRSGTERTSVARISDDVLFVSWLEDSGTTVSHVLDLRAKKVWSFVTYAAGEGRKAHLDVGEWTVIEPAPSR
jgi:hypothetical protein